MSVYRSTVQPVVRSAVQPVVRSAVPGSGIAAQTLAYADAVEAGSGVRPTDLAPVDALIRYLVQIERYNQAALFLGKSSQNAGTGAVWYNAGGWGGNHTLYGGPTWTANGIDFDGVNDYGRVILSGFRDTTDIYVFTRHRPDVASVPDGAVSPHWSWGSGGDRRFILTSSTSQLSGETIGFVTNIQQVSSSPSARGSSTMNWASGEDFVETVELGPFPPVFWKCDTQITLDLSNGVNSSGSAPADAAIGNDVFKTAEAPDFGSTFYWSGVKVAELVLDCSASPLTSTERNTIRALLAAL